ncbi:MAG TPA: AarF/ABC1/UbiB kinase family protein [Nevskiaceae bacterium]|nr:AarF/ABC1/UbiB kinase family protein [Nevskiaceae bacterium]
MPTGSIAALKRQRTKRLARLGAKVYYLRKRGREQAMYDLICEEFVDMGGVYIKFLQGVLFNTPLMRRWHSPSKLKIFEDVKAEPMDVIQVLRDELTTEQLSNIALIQPEPFAAGSFGQVYRGQHINGKPIVIKVLRPMIRELLKYDLRLLSAFSKRFAAKEYTNITVKMDTAVKEFRTATLNETDYVAEATFAHELYEAYKDHPAFVIPETFLNLCTPHLIVQEYVEGVSGARLLRAKQEGADPQAYVREHTGSNLDTQLMTLGIESMLGAFTLPRMQGDPHPGNVRFMTNNRIGLIDFGISAPAPHNKAAFFGILFEWSRAYQDNSDMAGMFEQFIRFFVNDLYRALKKLSTLTAQGPTLPEAIGQLPGMQMVKGNDIVKEIGHMVQRMFDSATGTRDVRDILNDGQLLHAFGQMVNKDNRLGLIVRLESSEVLRAAQTYIALLEALGRRADLLPLILTQVVERVEREHPDIVHQTDNTVSMSQAIGIVNQWLERVAVRDPAMFVQLMQRIDRNKLKTANAAPTEPLDNKQEEPTNA